MPRAEVHISSGFHRMCCAQPRLCSATLAHLAATLSAPDALLGHVLLSEHSFGERGPTASRRLWMRVDLLLRFRT